MLVNESVADRLAFAVSLLLDAEPPPTPGNPPLADTLLLLVEVFAESN